MNPDVKFSLEAFFEKPMALTAEGDLLLENQKNESVKNRTWAVASPMDSVLSKINHVFSDSSFCLETHGQSKATATYKNRWTTSRQKGNSNTSKGINAKFLVCKFNVNSGFTVARKNIGRDNVKAVVRNSDGTV